MNIVDELKKNNLKFRLNESMKKHTTLRIGGNAKYYIEVYNISELNTVLSLSKNFNLSLFIIGAGSNLLVSDSGIDGFVLRFKGEFEKIDFIPEKDECIAGSGVMLPFLIKKCVDMKYSGLEQLSGIPGTVGGGIVMNAGTNKQTIFENLVEVTTINKNSILETLPKQKINYSYRKTDLEGKIILNAKFKLKRKSQQEIVEKITEILLERSKTQPLGTLNAGSIFKNPENNFAGKLIEECGLKGFKIGNVYVSDKHANFIINSGNATAEEIKQLIFEIRNRVYKMKGIKLELELKII